MTRPTEILDREHRMIGGLLDRFQRVAIETLRTGALDVELAGRFVAVLGEFVEGRHREKEEALLLPLIERRGVPGKLFRLARAIEDSDHEPETVSELARLRDAAERGEGTASTKFAQCALGYVDRLRRHMAKEDLVFFPIAEAALLDADRAMLLEAFCRVDDGDPARAGRERVRAILQRPMDDPVVVTR